MPIEIYTEKILETEYRFLNADTDVFLVVDQDGTTEIVAIEII